jgi:hypothetical protein
MASPLRAKFSLRSRKDRTCFYSTGSFPSRVESILRLSVFFFYTAKEKMSCFARARALSLETFPLGQRILLRELILHAASGNRLAQ